MQRRRRSARSRAASRQLDDGRQRQSSPVARVIVASRLEIVTHGIPADLFADGTTAHTRGSPVDAAPHARIDDVIRDGLEGRVGFDDARRSRARERDADSRMPAENMLEDLLGGARVGGMARDVVGWSLERSPCA